MEQGITEKVSGGKIMKMILVRGYARWHDYTDGTDRLVERDYALFTERNGRYYKDGVEIFGGKDGVNEALRKTKENYQSRLLIPKLIEMKGKDGVKEVLGWEERRKERNQYFYYADDRRCYETEQAEYELACSRITECKACLGE